MNLAHTAQLTPTNLAELHELVDAAADFASQAKAPSTRLAYRRDWAAFCCWCQESGFVLMPARPEAVALYVAHLAREGLKPATINRVVVAISQAHKHGGHESPTAAAPVRETLKGIRRTMGTAQEQKAPVTVPELRRMLAELPEGLLGVRDRSILLLGFAGAFRRSELTALDVADLEFVEDGLVVVLRVSKTDQERAGRRVGIPFGSTPETCPVRAVRRWLREAAITSGPVFRTVNRWGQLSSARLADHTVARVVKRHVARVGLDPSRFSGHSLRAGFATSAARAGKPELSIMNQTGHRSVAVLRTYIRRGSLFTDNAAAGLL